MADRRDPRRTRISSRTIPSWLVLASVAVVVVAVVGFFVSGSPDQETQAADPGPSATSAASPTPTTKSASPEPKAGDKGNAKDKAKKDKLVTKDKQVPRAYVEVYNNTQIAGLADSTSARVQGAGWKVVGTDNWYGNIPDTTVYYPDRLKKQAELLAEDLKIDRVRPAVEPMRFDRLTLILTGAV
ncbi:MAG: LytR C-terminal domain-containing protein [Nocardioidaceae bacterium]